MAPGKPRIIHGKHIKNGRHLQSGETVFCGEDKGEKGNPLAVPLLCAPLHPPRPAQPPLPARSL